MQLVRRFDTTVTWFSTTMSRNFQRLLAEFRLRYYWLCFKFILVEFELHLDQIDAVLSVYY
jgi:hypothetical protein